MKTFMKRPLDQTRQSSNQFAERQIPSFSFIQRFENVMGVTISV